MEKQIPAWLVLEDGAIYTGLSIGATGHTLGELVFNTSATGYQEVLTDPSYRGQIVLMTYPEIGNYGVNPEDYESERIHAAGFVVKHLSPVMSSWRAHISLQEFLASQGIVGIQGVDTRAITTKIRVKGALKSGITTDGSQLEQFVKQVGNQPSLDNQDLVAQVTASKTYTLNSTHPFSSGDPILDRLVVIDFGAKKSILNYLAYYARQITVVPANTDFQTIEQLQPQAVLLSNGPGDPSVLHTAIQTARELVASGIPTFGICLGHQILAIACGANVTKMQFGHHGGNHPVKDLESGQITITSQNHGYSVTFDAFPEDRLKVTHVNLNDGSIEGFRHIHAPVASVQFHPEASPGPHDSRYLFRQFAEQALSALAVG